MSSKNITWIIVLFSAFLTLFILSDIFRPALKEAVATSSMLTEEYLGDGSEQVRPLPLSVQFDLQKVALGEKLFNDPLLSGNGFSCATCHQLNRGGTDGLPKSLKTGGGFDVMNTPTVFNVAFNQPITWHGRLRSLEAQLDDVINNPLHMASSWEKVIAALRQHDDYPNLFSEIYTGQINRQQIVDALVTFQNSLITPNSAFDRYLRGDQTALSALQQQGYELFRTYGCISCHQGVNLGGNLMTGFGIYDEKISKRLNANEFDLGRFMVTGDERDRYVFRVPSLRNVALTAPYFHNGSAETLNDAIKTMAQVQLGVALEDQEVDAIKAFLTSLTGEYKGRPL